jgi:hypothetical protein
MLDPINWGIAEGNWYVMLCKLTPDFRIDE